MLIYFNSNLKTWVESNILNSVVAAILSQKHYNRMSRLIIFIFKKMFFLKCNYKRYNKELLAIIQIFKE